MCSKLSGPAMKAIKLRELWDNKNYTVWDGKIILDPKDCTYYVVKNGKRKEIDFNVFTNKKGKLIFIED